MLVVGLTGGIGAGKTTVANLFAQYGIPIIDADVISRELTQPGQAAFAEIVTHFQQSVLLKDKTLDRAKLRQIVFDNLQERRWLENLLHPLIQSEINSRLKKISAPYCILVIPLLLEVGSYSFVNRILVIDTPEEVQIERIVSRDHISPMQVKTILKTQVSRQFRLDHADDVIVNDGNTIDLESKVEKLHHKFLNIAKKEQV